MEKQRKASILACFKILSRVIWEGLKVIVMNFSVQAWTNTRNILNAEQESQIQNFKAQFENRKDWRFNSDENLNCTSTSILKGFGLNPDQKQLF
jgi:hypothetical protein